MGEELPFLSTQEASKAGAELGRYYMGGKRLPQEGLSVPAGGQGVAPLKSLGTIRKTLDSGDDWDELPAPAGRPSPETAKPSPWSQRASRALGLASLALATAPLLIVSALPSGFLGLGMAQSLGLAGFALGAVLGISLGKDLLERFEASGRAFSGGMALSLLGGGLLGAAAGASLAAWSAWASALVLSGIGAMDFFLSRTGSSGKPVLAPGLSPASSKPSLFQVTESGGKYRLRISKEQLEKPYLLSATVERGLGSSLLLAPLQSGEFLWYFRRSGGVVELAAKRTDYRAREGSPMARAIEHSIPDPVKASAKILEEDSASGSVTIELDSLFLKDLSELGFWLAAGGYTIDSSQSRVEEVRPYPRNVEIRSRLMLSSAKSWRPAGVPIVIRYSLSELPEGDYRPRQADDRIGYFTTDFQDWSDDQKRDLDVHYVNRWKLEKQDPKAELSPVKEPIVFWLEDTIPEDYREAVARGILAWNKAFERIGFKDAVVVRQQPKKEAPSARSFLARVPGLSWLSKAKKGGEEDFDPADSRFNVIRWFLATDGDLAMGPSRANPLTGQIYNAGVSFAAGMVRMGDILKLAHPGKSGREEGSHRHPYGCGYAQEAARQAALAYAVLAAREGFSPEEKRRFVNDFVTDVMIHEIGHTLGLRHNFRASAWLTPQELSEAKGVISGSVMDYNAPNIAPPGRKQGSFWQTELGPYDTWAIEYGYRDFPDLAPQEESQALARIASRAGEPGLAYATDEDVTGMDPLSQRWDLGADPLEFARGRAALVREFWKGLERRQPSSEEGFQELRKAYALGWGQYYRAVSIAARFVGGIHFHRSRPGDPGGKLPYEPVPASKQEEAMDFLEKLVFSDDPFELSPEFIRKLAPQRQPSVDKPWTDLDLGHVPFQQWVLRIRGAALEPLLDPATLERLVEARNMAADGEEPFTVRELFARLAGSIWSEILGGKKAGAISAWRRDLQQEHVSRLLGVASGKAKTQDFLGLETEARVAGEASALARKSLLELGRSIKRALKGRWDKESRAHLEGTLARIKDKLE